MKKKLLLLFVLFAFIRAYSQVGINTGSPAATLDISSKNATGTSTNVDGLLIARLGRERAQSMTGVPVSTLIYVNSVATGTQTGTAVNIDTVGYYYYTGTAWVKLHNPTNSTPSNIYNSDGVLTGNRTVSQGSNTLAFTGTQANAFSVDGNTLSVDAASHRLGVGTTTPTNKLVVTGTNAQPSALGTVNTNATLRVDGNTSHALDFGTYTNTPFGSYISSQNKTAAVGLPLVLNPVGGNVGVATASPGTTLDVNGAITNRETALAVAGNAVTIPANVSQVQLTGAATATIAITAPAAPNAGQRIIVYNNTTGGFGATLNGVTIPNGQALEYVYSNSGWRSTDGGAAGAAPVNIYTADGTLTGNRTVTQGANTLAFTGTQTNAFSVDNTTLSVDAANNRVGVGTTTPDTKLTISTPDASFGLNHTNGTINLKTYIGGGNGYIGTTTANDLLLMTNNSGKMTITSGGIVGLGTSAPSAALDIMSKGTTSATNALEINDSTNKELVRVRDDGAVRLENYKNIGVLGTDANGFLVDGSNLNIPSLSFAGLVLSTSTFAANSSYNVIFGSSKSTPNITYNNGVFVINKAGFYQFTVFTMFDISMNSLSGGSGSTIVYQNDTSTIAYQISHELDGLQYFGNTLSGIQYFNVGDFVRVYVNYTKSYRMQGGTIGFVYYGI